MTLSISDSITMLCHYAECRVLFVIMLNVIILNVIMLSVEAPQLSVLMSLLYNINGLLKQPNLAVTFISSDNFFFSACTLDYLEMCSALVGSGLLTWRRVSKGQCYKTFYGRKLRIFVIS